MSRVEFVRIERGEDVLVDGLRVPLLEAFPATRGRTMLVFDRRMALEVGPDNYEHVTAFVADVIAGCLDYHPHFNRVHEITGTDTEADPHA